MSASPSRGIVMQFETFRGRNVEEALAAVKAALGPDAFIESTRHVSNGEKGWLGKSFVEVLAAPEPSRARGSRAEITLGRELRLIRSMLEELSLVRKPRDRAGSLLQAAGIEGSLAAQLAGQAARVPKADST